MLEFASLSKGFWIKGHFRQVIDDVSLTLPAGRSFALLGRNGTGKSTLLQLISGSLRPDQGHVHLQGRASWPVGFANAFHHDLTGAQNIRFIARIYGLDSDSLEQEVRAFAEIGHYFDMPMRSYSQGMRARIAFGAAMFVPFDLYLIDEVTAVGDAAFRDKSKAFFHARLGAASGIMVSHNMQQIREFCSAGLVLENGKLTYFDDIEEAIQTHLANMQPSQKATA